MARKWTNVNLPGALHFITGNFMNRIPAFSEPECCLTFLAELKALNSDWPCKLIAYVLMPDHFHLITNPRDGRIKEYTRNLKRRAANAILTFNDRFRFPETNEGRQVWQESFKAVPLWSGWMIRQKVNYIHSNPVKAKLVRSARDYEWSSFRSYYSQGEEPLAVDHDWWWPDDGEKLTETMKEMGWYTYLKRRS